jgi:hypothetical protein
MSIVPFFNLANIKFLYFVLFSICQSVMFLCYFVFFIFPYFFPTCGRRKSISQFCSNETGAAP